jgi:hypothetical protein
MPRTGNDTQRRARIAAIGLQLFVLAILGTLEIVLVREYFFTHADSDIFALAVVTPILAWDIYDLVRKKKDDLKRKTTSNHDGNRRRWGLPPRLDLVSARLRNNFRDAVCDLVGLATLGLLVLLVSHLRWWTLAVAPALYCAIFLFKKRASFPTAFSPTAAGGSRDALLICWYVLILALVFTGVAITLRGSVYACFAASGFWLVTLLLVRVQMESANLTKRFAYYLVKGSIEFLIILTATLAVYSTYAWRISRLPLNTATLLQLRSWEKSIEEVHDRLETWNPSKLWAMLVIAALYGVRATAIRWGHGKEAVSRAWVISQFGLRWMNRLALVAAIAASFTFLATRADGPPGPLQAQLKTMNNDYSELRSQVESALAIEAKRQLVNRAWTEMPRPLRDVLHGAESIEEEKADLLKEMRWADGRYGLDGTPSAVKEQEYAGQLERRFEPEEPPAVPVEHKDPAADSATANDLNDAVARISRTRSEVSNEPADAKEEIGRELAKSVQAFVLEPSGWLHVAKEVGLRAEGTTKLAQLASSNPVLSGVLDMVNDAFNDYFYDRVQIGVDALIRVVLANRGRPMLAEVKDAATEFARSVQFRWRTNDQTWRSEINRQLQTQEAGVREARRQFQNDTTYAAKREARKLVAEIRQHEAEYEKIGNTVLEHKDLLAKKDEMEAQVRQLESRASSENPLSGFPTSIKAAAARDAALQRFMKSWEHPADAPAALRALNEELKALNKAWPPTAFDQLVRLDQMGTSEIREIVGESQDSVRQHLRDALGEDVFDGYEREYEFKRTWLTERRVPIPGTSEGISDTERSERPNERRPEGQPEPSPIERIP